MTSHLHDTLLLLFRNRPQLAAEVLHDLLGEEQPEFTQAYIDTVDLISAHPSEHRAELVVLLDYPPMKGIIVAVPLCIDEEMEYVWPVYVAKLYARLERPATLLAVSMDAAIVRWAEKPIKLGFHNIFTPMVLGPARIPRITGQAQALANPELAVLSVIAHGQDKDSTLVAQIASAAHAASATLDPEREKLYREVILNATSGRAREELSRVLGCGAGPPA